MRLSKKRKKRKEGRNGPEEGGWKREKRQEKQLLFAASALRSQRGLAWHKRGYQLHPWLLMATTFTT
jgi:hypothetical protein